MKVKVYPSTIDTNPFINLPPSKSIAHRAIICASLANGTSKLTPIEYSEDILATINGAKELGSTITTLDEDKMGAGASAMSVIHLVGKNNEEIIGRAIDQNTARANVKAIFNALNQVYK